MNASTPGLRSTSLATASLPFMAATRSSSAGSGMVKAHSSNAKYGTTGRKKQAEFQFRLEMRTRLLCLALLSLHSGGLASMSMDRACNHVVLPRSSSNGSLVHSSVHSSVHSARDAIRDTLAASSGRLDRDVVVCLSEGIHDLSTTLEFTAEDSVRAGGGTKVCLPLSSNTPSLPKPLC